MAAMKANVMRGSLARVCMPWKRAGAMPELCVSIGRKLKVSPWLSSQNKSLTSTSSELLLSWNTVALDRISNRQLAKARVPMKQCDVMDDGGGLAILGLFFRSFSFSYSSLAPCARHALRITNVSGGFRSSRRPKTISRQDDQNCIYQNISWEVPVIRISSSIRENSMAVIDLYLYRFSL